MEEIGHLKRHSQAIPTVHFALEVQQQVCSSEIEGLDLLLVVVERKPHLVMDTECLQQAVVLVVEKAELQKWMVHLSSEFQ